MTTNSNKKETPKEKIKELEEKLKNMPVYECEIYSRVVGYFRPIKQWNKGKQTEWTDRTKFTPEFLEK